MSEVRPGSAMALTEQSPWSTEGDESVVTAVSLLSFTAEVQANCRRVAEALRALYPASALRPAPPLSAPRARFYAEELPVAGGARYRVSTTGGAPWEFGAAGDTVAFLEQLINAAAVANLGSHIFVHAGAVAGRAGGVIVPGASGIGKSTLVAALSLSGFAYYSDELAVLAGDAPNLRPFLKAICLKEGGWRALANCCVPPPSLLDARRADGEPVRYLLPPLLACAGDAVPIRYVLLPERRAGARASLAPVARTQALAALAANSLNLPRHGQHGVEALARVVEGAECYRLVYNDLPRAVAAVTALVGHPRPAVEPSSEAGS
ncbi:MAG: hypothetical protein ACYC4L_03080 [Chloroflexota bacterium]